MVVGCLVSCCFTVWSLEDAADQWLGVAVGLEYFHQVCQFLGSCVVCAQAVCSVLEAA